jgi:hypothetical protein
VLFQVKHFETPKAPILCQNPEKKNDATIKMRRQEPVEALLLHMIEQRCFKVYKNECHQHIMQNLH